MRRLMILLISLNLSPLQAPDPVEITPGSSRVSATHLEPYTARWRQWVTEVDGTVRPGVNTITDQVTHHETAAGATVLVRDLLWESDDGSRYRRVDVLDPRTLAPLRMRTTSTPDNVTHVDIDGLQVTSVALGAVLEPQQSGGGELSGPAFNWSSDGFLLAGLDASGLPAFRLPVLQGLTAEPRVGEMMFVVEGTDRIDTGAFGVHDAVVVRQAGAGSYHGRYWISREPPYVVGVEFTQTDGPITRWELF